MHMQQAGVRFLPHLAMAGMLAGALLAAVPQPKQEFDSLAAVAEHAQAMEQINTKGINAVFEAALAAKDYPGQVFMHWFINEQVEE